MDPPPKPPQIPEGFLQLCIRHEYFKRNSAQDAHQNVCQMIDSQLTRRAELQLPDLEPEFGANPQPDPPTPKRDTYRDRYYSENVVSERIPDNEAEDQDSDDSRISEDSESISENEPEGQCTLRKAEMLYKKLAKQELKTFMKPGRLMRAVKAGRVIGILSSKDIMEILSIRRIIKTSHFDLIQRPIFYLKTLISYRKLSMDFRSDATSSIHYMSAREGCLIWYGDTVKVEKTQKYQSVAANDFVYLIRHIDTRLERLEFDIEDYRKWDPPVWPFQSFFGKINNYMRRRNKIRVCRLFMKVFYNKGLPESGQKVLGAIWNHLRCDILKTVKLRVWDDSEVLERRDLKAKGEGDPLRVVYHSNQWRNIRDLDICDWKIVVDSTDLTNYSKFTVLRVVRMCRLSQKHYEELFESFYKNIVFRNYLPHSCIFMLQHFFFPTAKWSTLAYKQTVDPRADGEEEIVEEGLPMEEGEVLEDEVLGRDDILDILRIQRRNDFAEVGEPMEEEVMGREEVLHVLRIQRRPEVIAEPMEVMPVNGVRLGGDLEMLIQGVPHEVMEERQDSSSNDEDYLEEIEFVFFRNGLRVYFFQDLDVLVIQNWRRRAMSV